MPLAIQPSKFWNLYEKSLPPNNSHFQHSKAVEICREVTNPDFLRRTHILFYMLRTTLNEYFLTLTSHLSSPSPPTKATLCNLGRTINPKQEREIIRLRRQTRRLWMELEVRDITQRNMIQAISNPTAWARWLIQARCWYDTLPYSFTVGFKPIAAVEGSNSPRNSV